MTRGRVLLAEDDAELRATLELDFRLRDLEVVAFPAAVAALEALRREPFDVVLTDVRMSGMDGIAFCAEVARSFPDLPVILMTGFGSLETAIAAIRAGAFDFVQKPVALEVLALAIDRALKHRALHAQVRLMLEAASTGDGLDEMLGASEPMQRLFRQIERAAASDASVLVTGDSGSGKELVARALHRRSGRRNGPFAAVNCGALSEALLESELFGHVKGAFTDARADRKGLFSSADGGTLFLDEVGDCPLTLQVKLLRVLEARRVRPVGADRELPFDVRVVTATHRDLESEVTEKRFREDLYFRLNVVHLRVPPLRERGADVLQLARAFLSGSATAAKQPEKSLAPAAAQRLLHYPWPGNVRELRNAIERAVVMAAGDTIGLDDLPEKVRAWSDDRIVLSSSDASELVTMEEIERRYVTNVLASVAGNKTLAARILGFDRKTLYRKLERYGLDAT